MDRGEQNVPPLPENPLGAVAMMAVDIQHRDPRRPPGTQAFGGDGGVVQIAMPAGPGAVGMVSRRAGQGIGGPAGRDRIRRGDGAGSRGLDRHPGALADRAGAVGGVPAKLADDVGRRGGMQQGLGRGMGVRHHLLAAIGQGFPGRIAIAQEGHERGIMHRGDGAHIELSRRRDRKAHGLAGKKQRLGAGRHLEIRTHLPAH